MSQVPQVPQVQSSKNYLDYIDTRKTYNKLYTPNHSIGTHSITSFEARKVTKPNAYGTSKQVTVYNIEKADSHQVKRACCKAVSALKASKKLEDYEYIMMTKRAECWIKTYEGNSPYVNNIFFKVDINNEDFKVFITPILTNREEPALDEEEDTPEEQESITPPRRAQRKTLVPRSTPEQVQRKVLCAFPCEEEDL